MFEFLFDNAFVKLDFPWLHKIDRTDANVQLILDKMETMMSVLDDLEAKVTSIVALLHTIHDELVAALASNDPVRLQAVVDKLAQAMVDNPDPTPVPPPGP